MGFRLEVRVGETHPARTKKDQEEHRVSREVTGTAGGTEPESRHTGTVCVGRGGRPQGVWVGEG